ncbi:MAG: hypothetical protein KatS3mg050_2052 [Litorilinea sp.]|nr:MAG: hypothetical protein KatS3mg050_2052 [Litorilinea sp.]
MADTKQGFQLFNLETMSGVFPGTRTRVFQRVRLYRRAGSPRELRWFQLLWYEAPAACLVAEYQPGAPGEPRPLLRLAGPPGEELLPRLEAGLAAAGWALHSCGSCVHWRSRGQTVADGLPLGHCGWRDERLAEEPIPALLTAQSGLALGCQHWQARDATSSVPLAEENEPLPPLPKAAELAKEQERFWPRLRAWLTGARKQPAGTPAWQVRLVERSGVGAGTEPCFACQGRIANLGALTVGTAEGDKQTFSVWRCRLCHTLYLNDWIDRWERLESLETAETYYRIAPAEALQLLRLIDSVSGGEHPARREERDDYRRQILAFLSRLEPLTHQVKQGR